MHGGRIFQDKKLNERFSGLCSLLLVAIVFFDTVRDSNSKGLRTKITDCQSISGICDSGYKCSIVILFI